MWRFILSRLGYFFAWLGLSGAGGGGGGGGGCACLLVVWLVFCFVFYCRGFVWKNVLDLSLHTGVDLRLSAGRGAPDDSRADSPAAPWHATCLAEVSVPQLIISRSI